MKTNYVLVDYENVKVAHVERLSDERFRVTLFLGTQDTKLPLDLVLAMQQLRDRGSYVVLDAHGHNALDFHIAYYLGILAAKDPTGFFHIVSRDTGFDPLIRHLKTQGLLCARSASVDELPCFVTSETGSGTAKEPATARPPAQPKSNSSLDDLVRIAADDLIKRKASRPRKEKTLRSTLQATCGKQLPASQIERVFQELVKRGWVTVSGASVTYNLPKQLT
ncbi:MAG: hypothetical protein KA204_04650 [Chromatiaceae bacterium]|nr:hypothetical protein [Chromatiaceae bacterium]MBP6733993.1 hypothetical protein [Chromatiaceae bacterium]MBP6807551.1 hypothetical protein [Chromatiaceae bacterium]MBP8283791.1 hypothetical protein [Chromatiaceae bacterium]MBP8288681.1 hypothetical protein [Chromatiaceae bacterium]